MRKFKKLRKNRVRLNYKVWCGKRFGISEPAHVLQYCESSIIMNINADISVFQNKTGLALQKPTENWIYCTWICRWRTHETSKAEATHKTHEYRNININKVGLFLCVNIGLKRKMGKKSSACDSRKLSISSGKTEFSSQWFLYSKHMQILE